MTLHASFVRQRGRRDRVYVTRSDGTTTGWDFPSYGDGLPHDACHLVIEDELGLRDGFWGLVDLGTEVAVWDNQATLLRDGRPWAEHADAGLEGLLHAEQVVARLSGLAASPADPRTAMEARATRRLLELGAQWRTLPDGHAIDVDFGAASQT